MLLLIIMSGTLCITSTVVNSGITVKLSKFLSITCDFLLFSLCYGWVASRERKSAGFRLWSDISTCLQPLSSPAGIPGTILKHDLQNKSVEATQFRESKPEASIQNVLLFLNMKLYCLYWLELYIMMYGQSLTREHSAVQLVYYINYI